MKLPTIRAELAQCWGPPAQGTTCLSPDCDQAATEQRLDGRRFCLDCATEVDAVLSRLPQCISLVVE